MAIELNQTIVPAYDLQHQRGSSPTSSACPLIRR